MSAAPFCSNAQDEVAEHARRANAAISANQSALAIQELEAWLRLEPKNITARANLGMVLFAKGEYPAASRQFENVLTSSPSLWSAKAFWGICQIRMGNTREGQTAIQESLPHVSDKQLSKQASLELIRSFTETGETAKAIPFLSRLQTSDGGDTEVQYVSYQIYSTLAAAALEKLSGSGQDSPRVHQVLAQAMMLQDKYSQAITEYDKAIGLGPLLPGLHLGKGQALLAENHTEDNRRRAQAEFMAEMQIDSRSADAAFQLGEMFVQESNHAEAKRWLTRALTIRPSFPDARVSLGEMLLQSGDNTGALDQLQLAVKQDPANRMAHYHLAQIYKKLGRSEEAGREFDAFRALSSSPSAKKPSVEIDSPSAQTSPQ
jgi:Tfp pilus assembly protein PilF